MDTTEIIVLVSGVLLIGFVVWFFFLSERESGRAESDAGGVQRIKVTVKGGYTPDVIVLKKGVPAELDFYRDEVSTRPNPEVHASHLPFRLEDHTVVLVDDVLFTGRTVRAGIEALFDYGRPARVQLAVLADRGHRELPIRPDYVGKNLPTAHGDRIQVELLEIDEIDRVVLIPEEAGDVD